MMDGIIFDVDGTLWDSTDVVAESWNQVIEENTGKPSRLTGATLQAVFGKTMDEITEILLPSLPLEERRRIAYLCFDHENKLLETKHGTLFDGVREVFEALSARTNLYIVSNCQNGYIEVFLKTTGLGSYISDYLCFGQTQVPKNETIRLLMERNHLENVVYLGDTQGDFEACQKAGIPFIFAEYGFGDAPGAPLRIQNIRDLLTLPEAQ